MFSQLSPPSYDRKMPRCSLDWNGSPNTAAYTSSGSCGCTRIVVTVRDFRSPTCCQVSPPSTDLYRPSPCSTFALNCPSPMPIYTTSGFDGATATAPTDAL